MNVETAGNLFSAFTTDNARNETDEKILHWMVPTDVFWSLFNSGHTLIYGSRGSGKTFVSRMASYPLLSRNSDPRAKAIIAAKQYIGVFVNTDLRFVGSTRSPVWSHSEFSDLHFVWMFNLNCLKSVCSTLNVLLETSVESELERVEIEYHIAADIAGSIGLQDVPRLADLPVAISQYESSKRVGMTISYLNGEDARPFLADRYSTEILEPIHRILGIFTKRCPDYLETNWLLFIDEAEFLTNDHLRIINSFMRTHSGSIFLKIATLPYHYSTFETNLGVALQAGDDYGVEFLDASPTYTLNSDNAKPIYEFARALYANRVHHLQRMGSLPTDDHLGAVISSLDRVLFGSRLLKRKTRSEDLDGIFEKLRSHLDATTLKRAQKLISLPSAFDDQIWRKVSGPIMLRDDFSMKRSGNRVMDSFSGIEVLVRCTDGVPRRMINVFQLVAREAVRSLKAGRANYYARHRALIPFQQQNRLLVSFAHARFAHSLAVPKYGPQLNSIIDTIGNYFHSRLHSPQGLSSDIIMSFEIDDSCPDQIWKVIQFAIAYGHVFPSLSSIKERAPNKKGIYRLSYSYAPRYQLYPAQGKPHNLMRIVRFRNLRTSENTINSQQLDLFNDAPRS